MDMSDSRPDDRPDNRRDSEDARWMTFKELAESRGISRLSAATLVRRHGWRRQRDNQGHVIALVPLTWVTPSDDQIDRQSHDQPDKKPDNRPDSEGYIAAFAAALAAVREAKDGEIAALRQQIVRLTAQSDTDHNRADALRDQIDDLNAKLTDAQTELAAAQDQAEAASTRALAAVAAEQALQQAEAERRGRGCWARLRAAWRGE
jgi:hypothetical protein